MTINTFLLILLVLAAYTNLYLTFKKRHSKKRNGTKLPISAKDWDKNKAEVESYKIYDNNFKSWLKNNERLEKQIEYINSEVYNLGQ